MQANTDKVLKVIYALQVLTESVIQFKEPNRKTLAAHNALPLTIEGFHQLEVE